MKKLQLLISLSLFAFVAIAQEGNRAPKTVYDRSSISWLVVDNQSLVDFNLLIDKMKTLNELDKYDINPLSSFVLEVNDASGIEAEGISEQLLKNQFSNQILSYWFSRKEDGSMSADLVFERGMYNAKDEDIMRSKMLKRGLSYVKDYGENLINNSHVIVIKVDNLTKIEENSRMDQIKSIFGNGKFRLIRHNYRGYLATVTAYLYKINFDPSQKEYLYENCWVNSDDSQEIKEQKVNNFNNLKIGFTLVKKETFMTKRIRAVQKFPLNIFIRKPSYDKLMAKLSSKIQNETIERLAKDYDKFEVKVPVYNTKPIVAKVGKKEGLKRDDRYFVYEYTIDSITNQKTSKKVGVVRASSIVNNKQVATGNMAKSKFKQNWGEKIEPGQLLVEKNDLGYSGSFGYEFGKVQGLYWKVDILMGRAFRFPISNLYLTIGGAYETKSFTASGVTLKNQKMLRYTYAFTYPIYIGHNVNLKPFGGLCAEQLRKQDNAASGVKSSAWVVGLDASYGFTSYFELYGGAKYYGFYNHDGWDDFYKDRSGLSFRLGLRFSF